MLLQSFFRYATKPERLLLYRCLFPTTKLAPFSLSSSIILRHEAEISGKDYGPASAYITLARRVTLLHLLSSQHMVMAIYHVYSILGGYEVEPLRVGVQRYMEVADHFRGCQPSSRTLFLFV